MTASANTTDAVTTVTITTTGGDTLTVNLKDVTEVTELLLAARKDGYAQIRAAKAEANAAKKAERDEAKAARIAAAAAKKADQVSKLQAKLAALTA